MQRQHGSLVPVAEVVSGLNGPVKAIRDASPQARHHFTQADQVNLLVNASEADPDMGFMARLMALCSLPRNRTPGKRLVKRSFFETPWRRLGRYEISGLNWRNRPATTSLISKRLPKSD